MFGQMNHIRTVLRPAHTPVVELPVGPGGFPAPFLHSQGHLLKVAGVSIHKCRVDSFISICTRFRLWSCLAQTSSWENTKQLEFIRSTAACQHVNRNLPRSKVKFKEGQLSTYDLRLKCCMLKRAASLTSLVEGNKWATALDVTQHRPKKTLPAKSHSLFTAWLIRISFLTSKLHMVTCYVSQVLRVVLLFSRFRRTT